MEYKELQKLSVTELERHLAKERGMLYDLRLKSSVNQLRAVRDIRKKKADIARILTRMTVLKKEV